MTDDNANGGGRALREPTVSWLRNEFSSVEVSIDRSGNGPRLRVVDVSTGADVYLDPLQLESLIWLPPSELDALADPAKRWKDESMLKTIEDGH